MRMSQMGWVWWHTWESLENEEVGDGGRRVGFVRTQKQWQSVRRSIESECEAQWRIQGIEDIWEGYLEGFVSVIWSETKEGLVGT